MVDLSWTAHGPLYTCSMVAHGLLMGLTLLYQKDLEDLKDLEDFSAKQTKKRLTGVPLRGRNLTNLTNLTELNINLFEASGWHRAFGLSSVERPAPTVFVPFVILDVNSSFASFT